MKRFEKTSHSEPKRRGRFAAVPFYASILAANHLVREQLVVRTNDSVERKILGSPWSTFAAPELTGNRTVDGLAAVSLAALSIETGRSVRNAKEIAATAIAARGLATVFDVLSEHDDEQENVGISDIAIALGVDYLLHRADNVQGKKARLGLRALAAALAGGSVAVSYAMNDKPAASAHAAGAIAGGTAYLMNRPHKVDD